MNNADLMKNILLGKKVNIENLYKFVVEYCELNDRKVNDKLPYIIQMIQSGYFDLNYAIKQYCMIKKLNLCIIHNNLNQIIYVDIYE